LPEGVDIFGTAWTWLADQIRGVIDPLIEIVFILFVPADDTPEIVSATNRACAG
jgi:hypothetical protein